MVQFPGFGSLPRDLAAAPSRRCYGTTLATAAERQLVIRELPPCEAATSLAAGDPPLILDSTCHNITETIPRWTMRRSFGGPRDYEFKLVGSIPCQMEHSGRLRLPRRASEPGGTSPVVTAHGRATAANGRGPGETLCPS